MRIQEVAKETGLTGYTLRYYEKIGLIQNVKRNESGRRDYTPSDINWIKFLTKMKLTKMPLEELKHYANSYYKNDPDVSKRINLLLKHKERVLNEIKELQECLEYIDVKVKYYNSFNLENKIG